MRNKYIERLSSDLREYGEGYSVSNLKYMFQSANEFTLDEISHQPGGQIPWRTIIDIMVKSKSHEERMWYIYQAYKNGWNRVILLNQINIMAHINP